MGSPGRFATRTGLGRPGDDVNLSLACPQNRLRGSHSADVIWDRLYRRQPAPVTRYGARRAFITRAARKVSEAGGSLRDVQQLAGHASLQTTRRLVEGSTDAKRRLVAMI